MRQDYIKQVAAPRSVYVTTGESIRQHASAYVSIRQRSAATCACSGVARTECRFVEMPEARALRAQDLHQHTHTKAAQQKKKEMTGEGVLRGGDLLRAEKQNEQVGVCPVGFSPFAMYASSYSRQARRRYKSAYGSILQHTA